MSMLVSRTGVGRMRPGDHRCLIHDSAEEREAVFAVFVTDGLAGRQKVLLVGARPDREARFLADHGLDPAPYLTSGQLQLVAGGSSMVPGASVSEAVNEALRAGVPAVRVCRDAPRTVPGPELRRAEADLDAALAGLPVLALCAYDQKAFTGAELRAALRDHAGRVELDALHEDGLLRITRRFNPPALRLEGDVDASNLAHVAQVLGSECGRVRGRPPEGGQAAPLRIEAAGLDFIDVGGMRLLVQTASRLHRDGGRRLVLVGLAPHLRRVMRVVGWDLTPGLELVTEYGPSARLPRGRGPGPPPAAPEALPTLGSG